MNIYARLQQRNYNEGLINTFGDNDTYDIIIHTYWVF